MDSDLGSRVRALHIPRFGSRIFPQGGACEVGQPLDVIWEKGPEVGFRQIRSQAEPPGAPDLGWPSVADQQDPSGIGCILLSSETVLVTPETPRSKTCQILKQQITKGGRGCVGTGALERSGSWLCWQSGWVISDLAGALAAGCHQNLAGCRQGVGYLVMAQVSMKKSMKSNT